ADPMRRAQRRQARSGDDVHAVLEAIVAAYQSACAAVAAAPRPAHSSMRDAVYQVANYRATLHIKLRDDGTLATTPDDERSALNFRFEIDRRRQPTARIVVTPPEVTRDGPLHDDFFELLDGPFENRLAFLLGVFDVDAAHAYARSARQATLMIHVG